MKVRNALYPLREEFAGHMLLALLHSPHEWITLDEMRASFETKYGLKLSRSSAETIMGMLRAAQLPIVARRGHGYGYRAGVALGGVTILAVHHALQTAPVTPATPWACAKNDALRTITLASCTSQ